MMRNEGIDNKMTAAAADWQTAASPGPDDADILILIRLRSSSSVCRSCSESSRSSYSSYSTSSRYRATDSGLSRKILTLSNSSSLAVPSCPGPRLLGQEEARLLARQCQHPWSRLVLGRWTGLQRIVPLARD